MRKKINRRLYFLGIITLILTNVLSLFVYYNFYKKETEKEITMRSTALTYSLNEVGDNIEYLKGYVAKLPEMRITYIDSDGKVLFENRKDKEDLENHLDREEIKEAIAKGEGSAMRKSQTLGNTTYYSAKRLDDGTIIRVSRESKNAFGGFIEILPYDLGILIIILIISLIMSKHSADKIVKPLEEAGENIDDLKEIAVYDELKPFVRRIKSQNDLIKSQYEEIKIDRDKTQEVLNSMKEGLLLIDRDKNIISINVSGKRYFDSPVDKIEGQSVLALTRDEEVLKAIDKVFNEKTGSRVRIDRTKDGIKKYYKIYINPSQVKDVGAILLIMEVTKEVEAEIIRSEFTSNVSHELKSPLTSIMGFAEMIKSGMVTDEKDIKEFSGMIYKESSRLLQMIEELLSLSKLNEENIVLRENVNVRKVAEDVADSLSFEAKKKNIDIEIEGEGEIISAGTLIYEMLFNLVSNSIKYSNDDKVVRIKIEDEKDKMSIAVEDQGIGIKREEIPRIFERFYTVDKSRSKQNGGTGLGLSIVKHIINVLKGNISVESDPGKGTKFTITLFKD